MRVFTLALVLCFTASCGDPRPVLRIGTSGDYAPFSLDGQGFDVDVAKQMTADFGMRIEWVPFQWPDLVRAVEAQEFDVAMSGVTWKPERAVVGWMTRAVAAGGPCILGDGQHPARVGVNRGGFLEEWARRRFGDRAQVVAIDDNRALPQLLKRGEVQAIVTDSFELPHFRVEGKAEWCSSPIHRKVYWVADRASPLGPRMDQWLRAHETELRVLRTRWFKDAQPREPIDHVLDLVARRFAFMPAVGAYKLERGLAIEDRAREETVLRAVAQSAEAADLDVERARALFVALIDRSKRLQRRGLPGPDLDLTSQIRPALIALGTRLIRALSEAGPAEPSMTPSRLALLPGGPSGRRELWGLLRRATAQSP